MKASILIKLSGVLKISASDMLAEERKIAVEKGGEDRICLILKQ